MEARWRRLFVSMVAGLLFSSAAATSTFAQSAGPGQGQGASEGTGQGTGGPGGNGRGSATGIYHSWIPGKRYRNCIGTSDGGCAPIVDNGVPAEPGMALPAPVAQPRKVHGTTTPRRTATVPTIASIVTPIPRPQPPARSATVLAGNFVPDEVLATVRGGSQAVNGLASRFNLRVRAQRRSALLNAMLVRFGIPDGRAVDIVVAQLAADNRVITSAPNTLYAIQQETAPAGFTFQRIALDAGQANGGNVRVAVIDTAADLRHPALRGVVAKSYDAWPDMATEETDHATSIVGLIAGRKPFRGVAPGARIYLARAFEKGRSRMDVLLKAMDWAAGQKVRVINMSFAGPKNDLFEIACRSARARGILLVAAAGNEGPKAPSAYPAAFEDVMAVTATDAADRLMPQANRGSYVYVSAPGVDVMAPIPGGMDFVTGTSFAAAIVSGAAADLISAAPGRPVATLERALAETAVDLGPRGRDNDFGYGLIDVSAAAAVRD